MTRLAIVTGTSRGIGLAVARALLEKGWTVVGAARHEPEGLAHERYRHEPLDLADLPAVGRFYARLEPQLRTAARVGLVNNAAVLAPVAPIPELTPAELTNAYAVNVVAPVWLAGAFVRAVEAAPLRIVDLSSGAATSAYPGWGAYCGTKAALRMSGETLALELEEVASLQGRDVRIVSYAPHVVATAMQEEIRAVDEARFPRRRKFVELKESNALVPPEGPAGEIAALLEADDLPRWSARRFEP